MTPSLMKFEIAIRLTHGDERLHLFQLPDGEVIFPIYASTGVPTTASRMWIYRRGEGYPAQMDGMSMPVSDDVVDLDKGWKVISVATTSTELPTEFAAKVSKAIERLLAA